MGNKLLPVNGGLKKTELGNANIGLITVHVLIVVAVWLWW